MIKDKEIEQTCYQVKNKNKRYNIQHISTTMKEKQYNKTDSSVLFKYDYRRC